MCKSTCFFEQPPYGQLIKPLNREKIVETSKIHGGESIYSLTVLLLMSKFVLNGYYNTKSMLLLLYMVGIYIIQ